MPFELFRSKFIADTAFKQGKLIKDGKGNSMIQVDDLASAEQQSPSPTKSKGMMQGISSFFSNMFSSKTSAISESQVQAELAPRMSEEELMMFYGKLKYLQDSIRKCEFIELNPGVRSRCPVMCLSGFTSEDCDKADDWKHLISLYPNTELMTINWAAMTPTRVVTALKQAISKVDSGQLLDLVRTGIKGTFKKTPPQIDNPDEVESDRQRYHTELTANPFQSFQADQKGPGIMGKLFNFMGGGEKIAEGLLGMLDVAQNTIQDRPGTTVATTNDRATQNAGIYEFLKDNPFSQAYHNAVLTGQILGMTMGRGNLMNNNALSIVGFSLGSVITFSCCCMLYDLGCKNILGDVLLIGSTVDLTNLGQNIHKLIGSEGVIAGKLTICYTINDSVLAYLFKSARLGENPVGLKKISRDYIISCLIQHDPKISSLSEAEVSDYLNLKYENVNVSDIVEGHTDYSSKILKLMPRVDFNSDLQYFKQRS